MAAEEAACLMIYRSADWYDQLYPQATLWAEQCFQLAQVHASYPPGAVLDIGCGTGHALTRFAREGIECWGVDLLPMMVEAAKIRCPTANIRIGDMGHLELGRTFDVVISLGSVFAHALTNDDVRATLDAMAVHTNPGGILILEMLNGSAVLTGVIGPAELSVRLQKPGVTYRGDASFVIDRRRSRMQLTRVWHRNDQIAWAEQSEIRLMMPLELEGWLDQAGFNLVAIADNAAMELSELAGHRLWVVARRRASKAPSVERTGQIGSSLHPCGSRP
ncbi:class I SAM-dependent methyltransferase [Bradyrhizobium sp. SSUT77]|uniref:class I SAM-dependent methyltransferase n=1 Tax=Bradyrhizobium sp. SSUT77 TaxID=3040603 RepID=UPI002449DE05|nr:class I SAM-dependent methyltransferase [Bradyrhizobium sp. SSUT77]MDH2347767.1 methyltransferase domain-containing protein [Bradyrhizobium sp. SSUT77]